MSDTFMYRTVETRSGPGRVEAVSVTSSYSGKENMMISVRLCLFLLDTVVLYEGKTMKRPISRFSQHGQQHELQLIFP